MNILKIYILVLISFASNFAIAGYTEGKAALDNKQYELAIQEFTKAVNEGDKSSLFYLGYTYDLLGKTDEAVKWYKEVIKNKQSKAAYYNLGLIESYRNNFEQSASYFLSSAELYGFDKLDQKMKLNFHESMMKLPYYSKLKENMSQFWKALIKYEDRQYNSTNDDRDGKKWSISGGDFNLDGKFSISDLWVGFIWIFFYLGDWIHFHMLYTLPFGFSQFLELDNTFYGGWLSGITSLFIWLYAFAILINMQEDKQPSTSESNQILEIDDPQQSTFEPNETLEIETQPSSTSESNETLDIEKYINNRSKRKERMKELEQMIKLKEPLGYEVDEYLIELLTLKEM